MNVVNLTGRIVRDNELKTMPNGKEILNNTIAVKNEFKNGNGEYESQFINVVFFGPNAAFIAQYAPKGSLIEVVGRWQHRSYQDNQGNTKYVDECIVERSSVLISKMEEEKPQPKEQPKEQPKKVENPFDNSDDLPF